MVVIVNSKVPQQQQDNGRYLHVSDSGPKPSPGQPEEY